MPKGVAVEGGGGGAHVGGSDRRCGGGAHVCGSGRRWLWCPRVWQWKAVVVVPTCVAVEGGVVVVPTCVAVGRRW